MLSFSVLLATTQIFISLITVVFNVIVLAVHQLSLERPIPLWLRRQIQATPKQLPPELMVNDNAQTLTSVADDDVDDVTSRVTWMMVARYLDKVCFVVSFVAVTVVTIFFNILMHGH